VRDSNGRIDPLMLSGRETLGLPRLGRTSCGVNLLMGMTGMLVFLLRYLHIFLLHFLYVLIPVPRKLLRYMFMIL
jgi:hypothetical protein